MMPRTDLAAMLRTRRRALLYLWLAAAALWLPIGIMRSGAIEEIRFSRLLHHIDECAKAGAPHANDFDRRAADAEPVPTNGDSTPAKAIGAQPAGRPWWLFSWEEATRPSPPATEDAGADLRSPSERASAASRRFEREVAVPIDCSDAFLARDMPNPQAPSVVHAGGRLCLIGLGIPFAVLAAGALVAWALRG